MKKINVIQCLVALVLIFQTNNELHAQSPPQFWSVTTLDNPAPGYLRFDLLAVTDADFYLVDNYGIKKYIDSSSVDKRNYFQLLKNGLWIALTSSNYKLYNQDMRLVDSIPFISGSIPDFHEVTVLSNGHYLLLYTEENTVDLSQIVADGKPNATVISNVLIETDRNGIVYWTWRSKDHFNITEVTSDIDLTQMNIEFTHINAMVEDIDGNILVSVRHLDEIAKINKSDGNILWHLGGSSSRNNQFTFTNDDVDGFRGFSHQHAISLLSNGNILMYDNGNMKPTPYSRAVEYQINYVFKTATKVWEQRSSPDIFQQAMGSAYRLENGNTLINWSNWTSNRITEVRPDNSIAFELVFSDPHPIYRAYRVVTRMNAVILDINSIGNYDFNDNNFVTGTTLTINNLVGAGLTSVEKHNYSSPTGVYNDSSFSQIFSYRWVINHHGIDSINGTIKIKASTISGLNSPSKVAIYKRDQETFGHFNEVSTSYNSSNDEISAPYTGYGEFTIGSKILSTPSLSYPANNSGAIPINGMLQWIKLAGAIKYKIQVSTNSSFSQIKLDEFVYNSTEFEYHGLSNFTTYYWRVQGINAVDTSSWSTIYQFSTAIQIPELTSPTYKLIGANPIDSIKWKAVAGADYYWIQISSSEDFANLQIENKRLVQNSLPMITLGYNTKYYWKVLAYKNTDTSDWSPTWEFTTMLEAPKLNAPMKDSINISVNGTISWSPVSNAESYSLEVSKSSSFDTCIYKLSKLTSTIFSYSDLEYNRDYYWRVKASRKTDESNWSEIRRFKTLLAQPTLISPAISDTIQVVNGKLSFKAISPANSFGLQVSKSQDFASLILNKDKLNTQEITVDELPANTKLYWRVIAYYGLQQSDWSDVGNFLTGSSISIPSPKLITPVNNSICQNYGVFSWAKTARAIKYRLQVAFTNDFKILTFDTCSSALLSCDYSNFKNSEDYYWRVKAYSLFDSSQWSDSWKMTTVKLSEVKLLNPKNDQIQMPINGQLLWESIADIKSYCLQISDNPEFANSIIDLNNIKENHYDYTGFKQYSQYYWRVRYLKNSDTSSWSKSWIFTTESAIVLNIPDLENPLPDQISVPINGTLSWLAVPSATSYKISISTNQDFDEVAFRKTNLNDNKVNYYGLEYNQMYFWRVSASNDQSESQWSQVRKFLTELEMPNIVYPQDHSTGISLTGNIIWSEIPGSDTYIIQISTDSVFGNCVVNEEVSDPFYQYSLAENKIYYWRVKSRNYLNESQWSNTSRFKTIDPNGVEEGNHIDLVSLFPNPAIDKLLLTNDIYNGCEFYIYDASGTLVSKEILLNGVIDISKLCNGTYFIFISDEILRFVKQ